MFPDNSESLFNWGQLNQFDKAISATSKNLSDEAKSVGEDLNDYLLKTETILSRLDNPSKIIFTRLFKSETDLDINNKTLIEPFFIL